MKQMQLLRALARGPEMPTAEGTVGGVIYKREPAGETGIYVTLRMPSWRTRLRYPPRDDERMKVTAFRLPFGRNVSVEFCGTDIDKLCEAVAAAGDNHNQAVLALSPLLKYIQSSFRMA